jgi:hypothetical protein
VRCASAGAERREGGLCAGPAYVVIPQAKKALYLDARAFFKHTGPDLLRATPSELQGEVQPDRLALSRLCHEVRARIRAARSGNPGEFFALRREDMLLEDILLCCRALRKL